MRKCSNCGGHLRRVHRTLGERLSYIAIYQCRQCDREEFVPRSYRLHLGTVCRCPKCGTYRVVKLEKPDKIDKMQTGLLNWLEKLAGGSLYSCCFCRLQFYDRRRRNSSGRNLETDPVTNRPGTANSGA